MHPVDKIAARFLRDRKLSPPVDIKNVVLGVACIEEVEFPGTADAILLGANAKRRKPLILLQKAKSATRKIFTLAHELGHIIIPWHAGTFVCHTDLQSQVPDHVYRETEAEANRFASEVLMPSSWIHQLLADGRQIEQILQTLQSTGVSGVAASIALCRSLPTGYIFAAVSNEGEVWLSGRSTGTYVNVPIPGTPIDGSDVSAIARPTLSMNTPSGQILWWQLKTVERKVVGDELGDSRTILRSILNDITKDGEEQKALLQSVNGIVGAANGKARATNTDVYTVLKARFIGRDYLSDVINHRSFESFLIRKAQEIEVR